MYSPRERPTDVSKVDRAKEKLKKAKPKLVEQMENVVYRKSR